MKATLPSARVIVFRTIAYTMIVLLVAANCQWWPRIWGVEENLAMLIGIGCTLPVSLNGRAYIFRP